MPIANPAELVAEFKKSGEFDRLRRELLMQFRSGDSVGPLMSRVEDIIKQKLAADMKLHYMAPDAVHAELMQEMDRYPLVERAVADLPALSDPLFKGNIRKSITNLLKADRKKKASPLISKKDSSKVDMKESDDADSASEDEPISARLNPTVSKTTVDLPNPADFSGANPVKQPAPPSANDQSEHENGAQAGALPEAQNLKGEETLAAAHKLSNGINVSENGLQKESHVNGVADTSIASESAMDIDR